MNIPDHISKFIFKKFGLNIFKFFVADPVPGSGAFLTWGIRDGKFGSVVRDKHPGSATLGKTSKFLSCIQLGIPTILIN
jgi:hypothetical protein